MILKGYTKSVRLEFSQMMEAKISFLFYLIVPAIIIWLFANFGSDIVVYGNVSVYQYFGIRVLALIILFISIQLTILRIVGERAPYGTLDRDLLAISRSGMFLGKLTTNALFIFLQCIIIYLIAFIVFPITKNYANPLLVISLLFLVGLFGSSLGLLISVISKSKEQAVQLVPFLILLFLMVGDFFFIEQFGLSDTVKKLSLISPMSISYKLIQKTTSDTFAFKDMITGNFQDNLFLKLIIWICLMVVIGLVKFKLEIKK